LVGEIVHDRDFKDDTFGSLEADTLGAAIDALQLAYAGEGMLTSRPCGSGSSSCSSKG
jgi:hypothetical protein